MKRVQSWNQEGSQERVKPSKSCAQWWKNRADSVTWQGRSQEHGYITLTPLLAFCLLVELLRLSAIEGGDKGQGLGNKTDKHEVGNRWANRRCSRRSVDIKARSPLRSCSWPACSKCSHHRTGCNKHSTVGLTWA